MSIKFNQIIFIPYLITINGLVLKCKLQQYDTQKGNLFGANGRSIQDTVLTYRRSTRSLQQESLNLFGRGFQPRSRSPCTTHITIFLPWSNLPLGYVAQWRTRGTRQASIGWTELQRVICISRTTLLYIDNFDNIPLRAILPDINQGCCIQNKFYF